MANLGEIGDFFGGITRDVVTAWQGINAPSLPVPGVPKGPDSATRSQGQQQGASLTTILLVAAVGVLGLAFILSIGRK